jgi:hypothetical protein
MDFGKDLNKHKSLLIRMGAKGMSLFKILDAYVPGLEALQDLLEALHQEKVDRFCQALLNESPNSEPEVAEILDKKVAIDFFDLFRAFLADSDIDKTEYYARLTVVIGGHHLEPNRRKHYVSALKSLHVEDLVILRQCYLVKKFDLIPPPPLSGNGILTANQICSPQIQGELVNLSLTRLRAEQFLNDGGITNLGIEFVQSTHHRSMLAPDIEKDERIWQDGHVLLITAKTPSRRLAALIQALKARRIRAEQLPAEKFSSSSDKISQAKALVFFEGGGELTHSQQQSISRYANNHHAHCIRVGPFSIPEGMGMGFKATSDKGGDNAAAACIASNYGFLPE